VAEASKIIENTQRDLNIALMNELSIIFNKLNINTFEVLEAAGTKWNFLKFMPGLVGGHCIGVDPYYLTYKSEQLGYKSKVILSGRTVNDEMPAYVAKKVIQRVIKNGYNLSDAKILVMGTTFKEDVSDIRNSKVADLIKEMEAYNVTVDAIDPNASNEEMQHEYNIALKSEIGNNYQAIIVAVNHKEYANLETSYFKNILSESGLLVDIKGIYRNQDLGDIQYWSL
jgi:UDP-N-acetyl-D-galactosamine dehydrogenase